MRIYNSTDITVLSDDVGYHFKPKSQYTGILHVQSSVF